MLLALQRSDGVGSFLGFIGAPWVEIVLVRGVMSPCLDFVYVRISNYISLGNALTHILMEEKLYVEHEFSEVREL